jgi:hypothetical protein
VVFLHFYEPDTITGLVNEAAHCLNVQLDDDRLNVAFTKEPSECSPHRSIADDDGLVT